MKRDMDLIRSILLEVEKGDPTLSFPDREVAEILGHCELLAEAGLLEAQFVRGSQGDVVAARIQRLTWDGHEFLDASRSDALWAQAKKRVLETGRSWTLDGLKALLFELVRRNLPGG